MKLYKYILLTCAALGIISTEARADDLKVYSPRVEKGELALEANLNYSTDHRDDLDNYFSQVLAVEYGVTDYWGVELGGEIEKENGGSDQLTNLKWENIIAPWKPGENFIDTGLYIELEKGAKAGDPNNFEAKLLLEKDINKVVTTANLKVQHEFGPHAEDSWGAGAAVRTKYQLDKKFEPGLEYYADFGTFNSDLSFNAQNHTVGPIAEGKIGKVKYDTGVLFGVSDAAPDTTFKLNLEYEF